MTWLARVKLFEQPQFWLVYLIVLYIYYLWTRRRLYLLSWRLPGPLALPFIGNTYILLQDNIANIVMLISKYMELYRSPCRLLKFWNGQELIILVEDAGVASQINKMGLKPEFYKFFGGLYLQKGLAMDTDVDHWKWARKSSNPAFMYEQLKSYIPNFHNQSLHSAQDFQEFAISGESCMPLVLNGRYSFYSSMNAIFGYDRRDNAECDKIQKWVDKIFEHFHRRVFISIFRNSFIYWLCGFRRKEKKVVKKWLCFMQNIIDKKSHTKVTTENSFVTQMMKANMPPDEILTQSTTLLGAAVDTTKNQNTAMLLMLALHPYVQNQLHKEITSVLGNDVTRVPTYDDIMKLEYLDRVLKECMRILPAGPFVAKKVYKEMTVTADDGEYTIPAGTTLVILIYHIHNNPDYYEKPNLFDPDRWLPENVAQRHPNCFMPFSSGPRNCIGHRYAKLQMKMFAITMIRTYEILPSEHCKTMDEVKFKMEATLILEENCQIKLKPRNST